MSKWSVFVLLFLHRASVAAASQSTKTLTAAQGDNLRLSCSIDLTSGVHPVWTHHDDTHLLQSASSLPWARVETGDLVLSQTPAQAAGLYACHDPRQPGSNYIVYKVVLVAPTLLKPITTPKNSTVIEGKNITFVCLFEASAPAKYTWYRITPDGQSTQVTSGVMTEGQLSNLTVTATRADDNVVFQCRATNSISSVTTNASLTVLRSPTITSPLQNRTEVSGTNLSLHCSGDGNPKPIVKWGVIQQDGFPGSPEYLPDVSVQNDGQDLVFAALKPVHTGRYLCKLQNSVGGVAQTVFVTVQ